MEAVYRSELDALEREADEFLESHTSIIDVGALIEPRQAFQCSSTAAPGFSSTTASTKSPHFSCGMRLGPALGQIACQSNVWTWQFRISTAYSLEVAKTLPPLRKEVACAPLIDRGLAGAPRHGTRSLQDPC